jgi:hypothetical protein
MMSDDCCSLYYLKCFSINIHADRSWRQKRRNAEVYFRDIITKIIMTLCHVSSIENLFVSNKWRERELKKYSLSLSFDVDLSKKLSWLSLRNEEFSSLKNLWITEFSKYLMLSLSRDIFMLLVYWCNLDIRFYIVCAFEFFISNVFLSISSLYYILFLMSTISQ